MSKILIVLSAADSWTRADGSKYPTGYWAEEFIVIHEKFIDAGHAVDIATPSGKKPTADTKSLQPEFAGAEAGRFVKYLEALSMVLDSPRDLADVDSADYDAVVIPGGHGPVEDLCNDTDMGRLLIEADKAGKLIGSVCHGPAALLSATAADGVWVFAGRQMTAFSDEEEVEFGTATNAPWLLATQLREYGARYVKGNVNWAPFVTRDGNLITGQNPASSAATADAVLQALDGLQA